MIGHDDKFTALLNEIASAEHNNQQQLKALIAPLLTEAQQHNCAWAAHMGNDLAPYSQLGMQLALLHQGNLLSPDLYPVLQQAETETLAFLCSIFGQTQAQFCHGGTYANLAALWQARQQNKQDRRIVYGSDQSHYSIIKACDILGLTFKPIASDELGKVEIDALSEACKHNSPLAIISHLGTTSTGAIDPIDAIHTIAEAYSAWHHIDAAWGGAVLLAKQYDSLKQSVSMADSISFDPHKALFQPKPCSVVLYRNAVFNTDYDTDYLHAEPKNNLAGSYGGELFLPLSLNIKLLGVAWFEQQIEQRLYQAQKFATLIKTELNYTVLPSETGIVCFEKPDNKILSSCIEQGVVSKLNFNNKLFLRAVFARQRTSAEAVFKALQDAC